MGRYIMLTEQERLLPARSLNNSMAKKRKTMRYLVITALALFIAIILFMGVYMKAIDFSGLGLVNVTFIQKDSEFNMSGSLVESAIAYRGYRWKIKENSLYITIRGGLANRWVRDGSYSITISDERLHNVDAIYYECWGHSELLWPKPSEEHGAPMYDALQ